MKILKRSVPLWVLAVAILAVVSVAIAAIMVTRHVDITMHIKGYAFKVYDTDRTTELVAIDFGDLDAGQTYTFPEGANQTYAYYLVNTGDYMLYASYNLTDGLPEGVNFTIYIKNENFAEYYKLEPGEIYSTPFFSEALMWYIEIQIPSDVTPGDYALTLTWNGHDSPSG